MDVRMNSAGRIQPIRFGDMAQPGTCLLCNRIGHDSNELFATLNVELEFYGIAYLCTECCAEVADFIMFKSPKAHQELKAKYDALQKDWNLLRAQLAETKGLLNARIDSAGTSESDGDGAAGVYVPEAEQFSDDVDRILNDDKSVPVKSGKG